MIVDALEPEYHNFSKVRMRYRILPWLALSPLSLIPFIGYLPGVDSIGNKFGIMIICSTGVAIPLSSLIIGAVIWKRLKQHGVKKDRVVSIAMATATAILLFSILFLAAVVPPYLRSFH